MMIHWFRRIGLPLACITTVWIAEGCANFKGHPVRKAEAVNSTAQKLETLPAQLVGTIALVNEDEHFVLIDGEGAPPPAKGTALKSFRDGVETGILHVGSVHRRPFVVADIAKGTPQKGDKVFQ